MDASVQQLGYERHPLITLQLYDTFKAPKERIFKSDKPNWPTRDFDCQLRFEESCHHPVVTALAPASTLVILNTSAIGCTPVKMQPSLLRPSLVEFLNYLFPKLIRGKVVTEIHVVVGFEVKVPASLETLDYTFYCSHMFSFVIIVVSMITYLFMHLFLFLILISKQGCVGDL